MKTLQDCLNQIKALQESILAEEGDAYVTFEAAVKPIADQYQRGALSKLEYIAQIGKLINEFIDNLKEYDEMERDVLFNKVNELVNTLI